MISLIQHFEADILWKVSLKILNSGIILKLSPMWAHIECWTSSKFIIPEFRTPFLKLAVFPLNNNNLKFKWSNALRHTKNKSEKLL